MTPAAFHAPPYLTTLENNDCTPTRDGDSCTRRPLAVLWRRVGCVFIDGDGGRLIAIPGEEGIGGSGEGKSQHSVLQTFGKRSIFSSREQ